jgi:hypothetical protein
MKLKKNKPPAMISLDEMRTRPSDSREEVAWAME